MRSKRLEKLYESILMYAGMSIDNQGYINGGVGGNSAPVTVGTNRNRLVLPTEANMRGDQRGKLLFHPLTEAAIQPASEVVEKLRLCINIRINFTLGAIVQHLISLAASPALHYKLTPEQLDLVVMLKDADDSVVNTFINLLLAGTKAVDTDRLFVNTYIRRGGLYRGDKYNRVGVTTFLMYSALLKKDVTELHGVKLRPKDKAVIIKAFEFVFPGIDVPDQYNYGSNDNVAPWLHTLMETTGVVVSRLNDVLSEYSDYIDSSEQLMFNVDWVDEFKNLSDLDKEIRHIPPQDKVMTPLPSQPAPQYAQAHQPTWMPPQPTQPHQPSWMPAPPPQQYQHNYTPAQPTGSVMRNSDGTIDFRGTVQQNPNLAANGTYLPQQQFNQMQPQRRAYSGSSGGARPYSGGNNINRNI